MTQLIWSLQTRRAGEVADLLYMLSLSIVSVRERLVDSFQRGIELFPQESMRAISS